nr:hypothetical protein BJQ95_03322 [Cryobacterium sp. SO1]
MPAGLMIVMKSSDASWLTFSVYACSAAVGSADSAAVTTNGLSAIEIATASIRSAVSV